MTAVNAVEVTDLYVSKVKVDAKGSKERNKALKLAMQSVIIKVGGQQSLLGHAEVKKSLKQFNNYVRQYRYERKNNINSLVVTFDEAKINALFAKANLPIWGRLRPQILLWVVNEEGLSRRVVSESQPSQLPSIVKQFSSHRGLPIIMPLMDIEDSEQINIADLWGRFAEPIKLASQRYNAEAVVILRLSDSSLLPKNTNDLEDCELLCQKKSYAVDWSFIGDVDAELGQQFGNQYQGVEQAALINKALSDITDNIYQRYAVAATIENEMELDVTNVSDLETYMAIESFLQDLSSVNAVTLVRAEGTRKRFKLELIGSKKALLSSLKLNKQLQQQIDPLAAFEQDAIPVFYWGQ